MERLNEEPTLQQMPSGVSHKLAMQIGWVTGPPRLIAAIGKAHSFLVFCLSGSLQKAVGFGLDNEREFIRSALTLHFFNEYSLLHSTRVRGPPQILNLGENPPGNTNGGSYLISLGTIPLDIDWS